MLFWNLEGMINELKKYGNFDVIALQEVGRSTWEHGVSDLLDYFGKHWNLQYGGYGSVQGVITGFNAVILSRFPFQEFRTYHLPNTEYRSVMVGGSIQLNSDINNPIIINMYSLHLHTNKYIVPQIVSILNEMENYPSKFFNPVLMGDWNTDFIKCEPGCQLMKTKLKELPFIS